VLEPVPLPKLKQARKKMRDLPPEANIGKLFQFARGWRKVAIGLAAFAGLRVGEIRGLKVADVNFDEGWLYVRQSFSLDTLTLTKTEHERRIVILDVIRPALMEACKNKLPGAFVVTTRHGTPPLGPSVTQAFKRLEASLGMRKFSPHVFRHFFSTSLQRRGIPIEVIRSFLGHGSVTTTDRYPHATDDDLRDALAKLGNGGETGR
jgi:integrase